MSVPRIFIAAALFGAVAFATSSHAGDPAPAKTGAAKVPTASALLAAMDNNLEYESRSAKLSMVVTDGDRTRTYKMIAFGRGVSESAIEYVAPRREKGTRMLKDGDEMWIYMPRAERVQKISGHMMRQGMMGSDISYEDMLESAEFEDKYTARVIGAEDLEGRRHWKLEAIAKDGSVTYPKRLIWIDAEYYIPSRQELFAKSGMLLKIWSMSDVKLIDGKHVPLRTTIADQIREGSSTVVQTEALEFGVKLAGEVFSRRWLERGR